MRITCSERSKKQTKAKAINKKQKKENIGKYADKKSVRKAKQTDKQ